MGGEDELLSPLQAEGILRTAYDVIGQIGILLPERDLRARVLERAGRPSRDRIVFSADEVDGFLARRRARMDLGAAGVAPTVPARPRLDLSVMPYSHTYHDPETDTLVPLTARRMVAATGFLATFADEAVRATVPGHPVDVPAALQPVFQYKAGAQYNPAGGACGWLGAPRTAGYVLAMAEAMGAPIRSTVIYVFSPLRLGGDELRTAIALRDRLSSVHVGNMGSCGGSLPLLPGAALALSWAEAIAGAMCVEVLTGLPVGWSAGIEPFDLRAQTIPFGAPEQVLYYRLAAEARARLEGRPEQNWGAPLLTMAKLPGEQAAMEKTMAAVTAAQAGGAWLGAAGSLSADEVFSPVQLVLDCELRDMVGRLCRGTCHPSDTERAALETIREGVLRGTFMDTEATVKHYREVSWFPRHLRREMLGTWRRLGSPTAAATARDEAIERTRGASWRLPEPLFSRLEGIYEEAKRELGG